MRRFEDILRILSSVLLGTLVRDFELLSDGLKNYFLSHNSPFFSIYAENTATVTSIVLIAVYLRNIHASARYDEFIEREEHVLKIDRKLRWRVGSFLLALISLFGAPVAGHILAHHLPDKGDILWIIIPLFLPLAVYLVWDFALWLSDPEPSSEEAHREVEQIAWKWLFIDAVGLALVTILLIGNLALEGLEGYKQSLPPEVVAGGFVLIAIVIVLSDYLWNHRLYFPSYAEQLEAAPATTETAEELEQKIEELKAHTSEQVEALARLITAGLQQQQERIDQRLNELTQNLPIRRSPYKVVGRFLRRLLLKPSSRN